MAKDKDSKKSSNSHRITTAIELLEATAGGGEDDDIGNGTKEPMPDQGGADKD